MNDTIETSALIAPSPSESETEVNEVMSCWMRWSGLSTGVAVNRARW